MFLRPALTCPPRIVPCHRQRAVASLAGYNGRPEEHGACQGMRKSDTGLAPWQREKASSQPDPLSPNLETGQPGSMPPKKVLWRMATWGKSSYPQGMPEHFWVEGRS